MLVLSIIICICLRTAPEECPGDLVWSECANSCPHTCMDYRMGVCDDDSYDDCTPGINILLLVSLVSTSYKTNTFPEVQWLETRGH